MTAGSGLAPVHLLLLAALAFAAPAAPTPPARSSDPATRPAPSAAPTIVDLQAGRRRESVRLQPDAGKSGSASLTNLNPEANAWFLLSLQAPGDPEPRTFHIENADPSRQTLVLDAARPGTLVVTTGNSETSGAEARCALWPGDSLEAARRSGLAYAPLCQGRLYLRNAVTGSRTTLEATTQFLRDHVWFGEAIVGFVRRQVYQDAFIEHGAPASAGRDVVAGPAAPPPARLRDGIAVVPLQAAGLGIALELADEPLVPGRWRRAAGVDGVYVSTATPGTLADSPAAGGDRRRSLDRIESEALAFLVAFDLRRYELGFALGNEHPRLGWSTRVRAAQRDERRLGPDGIDRSAPLVRIGMVSPALQSRVAATFTGGFKREHGAFRYGELSLASDGSHYGFVEHGVIFSRLVAGLSTLYVTTDGAVDMKTWQDSDAPLLARIRHARQNGVPLIERDPAGGPSAAGPLVDQWGPGNWSGSADEKLRTLRAGACLLESETGRFLVYGYFSTATPRAMAQAFGAYGCTYAMHLDMNALEHTYLALYAHDGARPVVEHLVQGMSVLDKQVGDVVLPRFLGFPDDRDLFYLVARQRGP